MTITDTFRLNYLSDLLANCPHTELIYNDDPDHNEHVVGWTIRVVGCKVSEVTASTFRDCIDKDILATQKAT